MDRDVLISRLEYIDRGGYASCEEKSCLLHEALSALRAQEEAEKNEPLALDELRQMDGEPVWLVDMEPPEYGWNDGWYLICGDVVYNKYRAFPLKFCPGFAYRHKPKEGAENA